MKKKRGFRVLGAALVDVFSLIVGFPLWFLLLIEILKTFGLYNSKIYDPNSLENIIRKRFKKDAKEVKQEILELQGKEDEDDLLSNEENEQLIKNDNKNIKNDNNNIINNTIAINDVGDEIIINGEEHNLIPEGEEKPSMIAVDKDTSLF